jgi:hypothetical protein
VPNEIDLLMSLDPLELSAQNIDDIILYNRKQRLAYQSGVKPKKGSSEPINLEALGLVKKGPEIKKRKLT